MMDSNDDSRLMKLRMHRQHHIDTFFLAMAQASIYHSLHFDLEDCLALPAHMIIRRMYNHKYIECLVVTISDENRGREQTNSVGVRASLTLPSLSQISHRHHPSHDSIFAKASPLSISITFHAR